MDDIYNYSDGGYKHLSLHRRVTHYDPRNTDNLIILDYFNTQRIHKDTTSIYYKLLDIEYSRYKKADPPDLPISFIMVWHEITLAWVEIIHQMLFIEEATETFYAEYYEVIDNITNYDSIDDKDSAVYRHYPLGESVFHMAAQMWLLEKYNESKTNDSISLNKELRYVLQCYQKLEACFGPSRRHCIVYMMDFSGKTLVDYLNDFMTDISNGRF